MDVARVYGPWLDVLIWIDRDETAAQERFKVLIGEPRPGEMRGNENGESPIAF
ncbi:MAG: hypothetical protein PVG51_01620 [Desulfosarcina sp.]|jgi:hypothetical protein